jgi:hypothetical protein
MGVKAMKGGCVRPRPERRVVARLASVIRMGGYYDAADEMMNFINQLDTSGMNAADVRSAIYHKCLEMKP